MVTKRHRDRSELDSVHKSTNKHASLAASKLLQRLNDKNGIREALTALNSDERQLLSRSCRAFKALSALRQVRVAPTKARGLQLMQFALSQEDPDGYVQRWACAIAAEVGNLDALQLAIAQGCTLDSRTCASAAKGGSLECLRWARQQGCEWNEETCQQAAAHGHLHVVTYAHEYGCRWDESTCAAAAGGGHLLVLKYARENGCPWVYEEACEAAEKNDQYTVLAWIRNHACPAQHTSMSLRATS
mmetsp:Transcript_1534/g.5297  ORF Transcript_1534/g.5297 Transcript_1534/m.5297 type:complete len:245 (-) Transcript_1534:308-1042(-)